MDNIEIMKESEALLEGHFLLSSGRHSNKYCQCAKLLQYPDKAAEVLKTVVSKLEVLEFDVVLGPAMGGIIVAYEIGRQCGKKAIFTERENGTMTLRRGFQINPGDKVLITEDVVTTGKSSYESIKVVESLGAKVVGIACIVDRSEKPLDLPVYSAIKLDIQSYEASECPLCKAGQPYIKPGSRNIK